jgi:hypothetical protein
MDGRLVGLLLVVTVMTTGARWLHSEEADAEEAVVSRPARATALQRTSLANAAAPQDTRDDARDASRPVSAELCLALQDKLRALYARAAGEALSEPELLDLRNERRKAQSQLGDLRCAGGARAWF